MPIVGIVNYNYNRVVLAKVFKIYYVRRLHWISDIFSQKYNLTITFAIFHKHIACNVRFWNIWDISEILLKAHVLYVNALFILFLSFWYSSKPWQKKTAYKLWRIRLTKYYYNYYFDNNCNYYVLTAIFTYQRTFC